jgi:hypothetical protein
MCSAPVLCMGRNKQKITQLQIFVNSGDFIWSDLFICYLLLFKVENNTKENTYHLSVSFFNKPPTSRRHGLLQALIQV